jgi:hypothetical protein
MQVNPPVFFTSAGLTLAFAGLSALFPAQAKSIFDSLQAFPWCLRDPVAADADRLTASARRRSAPMPRKGSST